MSHICVVAPSAIPWVTGTSINPLFRAVHLAQYYHVTLHIPWIERKKQSLIYPPGVDFVDKNAHEDYIRSYIVPNLIKIKIPETFAIHFYSALYVEKLGSIWPTESLMKFSPNKNSVLILEEPGHLLSFQPFAKLQPNFSKVIGITHTNYRYYIDFRMPKLVSRFFSSLYANYLLFLANRFCDNIINVAPANSNINDVEYPINGVLDRFFLPVASRLPLTNRAYFIGKTLWEKGFKELIDLSQLAGIDTIDIFGRGRDKNNILAYAKKVGVNLNMLDISMNITHELQQYKLFINCSRSEEFCTTTAEALAMGKFVILPYCQNNAFFYQFKNCLPYNNANQFLENIAFAISHVPVNDPATEILSWQNATKNFLALLSK